MISPPSSTSHHQPACLRHFALCLNTVIAHRSPLPVKPTTPNNAPRISTLHTTRQYSISSFAFAVAQHPQSSPTTRIRLSRVSLGHRHDSSKCVQLVCCTSTPTRQDSTVATSHSQASCSPSVSPTIPYRLRVCVTRASASLPARVTNSTALQMPRGSSSSPTPDYHSIKMTSEIALETPQTDGDNP